MLIALCFAPFVNLNFIKKNLDGKFNLFFILLFLWMLICVIINFFEPVENAKLFEEPSFTDKVGVRSIFFGIVKPSLYLIYANIWFILLGFKRSLRYFLYGLIVLAVISCLYGIYQFIGSIYNLPFTAIFSGHNNEEIFLFGIRRLEGMFFEPGPHARYLLPVMIITFSIILEKFDHRFFNLPPRLYKPIFIMAFCLINFVLYMTFSPIAYIGPAIALIVFALINFNPNNFAKPRFLVKTFVSLLIIVVIGGFSLNAISSELNFDVIEYIPKKTAQSLFEIDPLMMWNPDDRAIRNYVGVKMFKDHPIFGVGTGNAIYHYYKYATFTAFIPLFDKQGVIHTYLNMLAENGVIGLILLLIVIGYPIVLFVKNKKVIYASNQKFITQGFFIAYITTILVAFQTSLNFFELMFWFLYVPLVRLSSIKYISQNKQAI